MEYASRWNTPEMNGYDFLLKVKEAGMAIPFGFVTSEGTPEMQQKATEAGARFLITKPFTPETFQKELSRVAG